MIRLGHIYAAADWPRPDSIVIGIAHRMEDLSQLPESDRRQVSQLLEQKQVCGTESGGRMGWTLLGGAICTAVWRNGAQVL